MTAPAAPTTQDGLTSAEAARLIEALSARLLGADSATAVLEAWCAERRLAAEPFLAARRVEGPDLVPSPAQLGRLALPTADRVRYRRVRLGCGGHILSEAENWYVPERLTPEMNRLLETTEAPFGRVVHALAPTRRNLRLRRLWGEVDRCPGPADRVFAIEAVLSDRAGRPICEVGETYTGAILALGTV